MKASNILFAAGFLFFTFVVGMSVRKIIRKMKTNKRDQMMRALYKTRIILLFVSLVMVFLRSIMSKDGNIHEALLPYLLNRAGLIFFAGFFVCVFALVFEDINRLQEGMNPKNVASALGLILFVFAGVIDICLQEILIRPHILSSELSEFIYFIGLLCFGRIALTIIGSPDWLTGLFLNLCRLTVIVLAMIDQYENISILRHGNYLNESVVASLVVDSIIKSFLERGKQIVANKCRLSRQTGAPTDEKEAG